jgi:hypothetical protein
MKKYFFLVVILWVIAGCVSGEQGRTMHSAGSTNPAVQEKEFGNTRIRLTYMPPCIQVAENMTADSTEVVFKLNVFSPQLKEVKDKKTQQALSYGIDTLFVLTTGQDSLAPLLAQRIANGNLRGAEYLLVFDRMALRNNQQVDLVFRDWLFTNVRMIFSVDISKIDSISCGL